LVIYYKQLIMKKADNFNPGQWLIENKLTNQSKLTEMPKIQNPTLPPDDIQEYLLGMIDDFGAGNDNEYEPGTEMEFRYDGIDFGDIDVFDEENINKFKEVRDYLERKGPTILNDKIGDLTFSTDGEDIIMNWVEPDWEQLNEMPTIANPVPNPLTKIIKSKIGDLETQMIDGVLHIDFDEIGNLWTNVFEEAFGHEFDDDADGYYDVFNKIQDITRDLLSNNGEIEVEYDR